MRSERPNLLGGVGGPAFVYVSLTLALLFLIVTIASVQPPHGPGMVLAAVNHPAPMPLAMREDAMIVTVGLNGEVFFGNTASRPINCRVWFMSA